MSITDDLRKWIDGLYTPNSNTLKMEGERIADRIDVAHRAALEKLAAQVDETSGMREFCERLDRAATNRDDVTLWGVDYTPLPLDADGVPIHVGDVMEWVTYDDTYESVIRIVDGVGADVFFAWSNDRAGQAQYEAQAYRHHRAPTVEDVLREFAREIDADAYGITDAKVAEFAAKLRLAGEGE